MWLLKRALNEWEYKQGEYYLVILAENKSSKDHTTVIVKIKSNDDLEWSAFFMSETSFRKLITKEDQPYDF